MPIVAFLGLIIILSLSGGLNNGAGLAGAVKSEPAGQVASATDARDESVTMNESQASSNRTRSISSTIRSVFTSGDDITVVERPSVTTLAALNIEDDTAMLRGEAASYDEQRGVAFVVYGYNLKSVRDLTDGYARFSDIPETSNDKARVTQLDRSVKGAESYNRRVSNLATDTTYYFKVCLEHGESSRSIMCGSVKSFTTNENYSDDNRFSTPRVSLSKVKDITDNQATLVGRIDMNDGVDGIPFFVYGESRDLVQAVDGYSEYSDIDEDDELLQKTRLGVWVRGQAEYEKTIEDLEEDTEHYYRMCVEYDGERSGLVCTGVSRFITDDRSRSLLPYVGTGAVSVSGDEVRIRTEVQMNDYNDGIAFVVVGLDQSRVERVQNTNTFANLRQSGYDLQKVLLDADLDSDKTFVTSIDFLTPGLYYYRSCVQYEAEDEYNRERDYVRCGDIRTFARY